MPDQKNVAIPDEFRERLYAKIRADIGSLMTGAEVKSLVDEAMQKTFFTPEHQGGSLRPPKIEQLVLELVEPMMRMAIHEWLTAHAEDVKAQIDKALAGGLVNATARALDSLLSNEFSRMGYNLQQSLQNALSVRR